LQRSPQSLSWPAVLAALRSSGAATVRIRDGKITEPAGAVRNRSSAKGTELCLFPGESACERVALVEQLDGLAKSAGRKFATAAKVRVGETNLLIESIADEDIDGSLVAVIRTRRPKLGYNQSQQTGDTTTFRNKRIKQW
jgi:hypothetical protein